MNIKNEEVVTEKSDVDLVDNQITDHDERAVMQILLLSEMDNSESIKKHIVQSKLELDICRKSIASIKSKLGESVSTKDIDSDRSFLVIDLKERLNDFCFNSCKYEGCYRTFDDESRCYKGKNSWMSAELYSIAEFKEYCLENNYKYCLEKQFSFNDRYEMDGVIKKAISSGYDYFMVNYKTIQLYNELPF